MKYEDRYYKISRDRLIYLLWLEHQVEAKKQREINYLNRMNNFFELRDQNNCKRIYESIKKL